MSSESGSARSGSGRSRLASTGFAWWGPHDESARRARLWFIAVAFILAMYVYAPLTIIAAVIRIAEVGPWRGVATIGNRIGTFGLVAGAVALMAASTAAIALAAWRGFRRATARRADARWPESEAERRVARILEGAALVNGIATPRCWIIDDPAPNALAFGRPGAGHVGITTGAFKLSDRELETLCMFEVTSLANRAYAYATSAIDVALVAEWCARRPVDDCRARAVVGRVRCSDRSRRRVHGRHCADRCRDSTIVGGGESGASSIARRDGGTGRSGYSEPHCAACGARAPAVAASRRQPSHGEFVATHPPVVRARCRRAHESHRGDDRRVPVGDRASVVRHSAGHQTP